MEQPIKSSIVDGIEREIATERSPTTLLKGVFHACFSNPVRLVGCGLIAFALLDVCLFLLGIADITGVIWAPILCSLIGAMLIGLQEEV